jgi:hypothetical protein
MKEQDETTTKAHRRQAPDPKPAGLPGRPPLPRLTKDEITAYKQRGATWGLDLPPLRRPAKGGSL